MIKSISSQASCPLSECGSAAFGYVTLSKLLDLSVPRFPHLYHDDDDGDYDKDGTAFPRLL